MKSKLVALVAIALAAAFLWFASLGDGEANRIAELAELRATTDARSPASEFATPEPATADPLASIPSRTADSSHAAETSRAPIGGPIATRATGASGRLIVEALDAETEEPLASFEVRLASETRFANESAHDPAGEIELALTPDAYSIVVSSAGHESIELPRAVVEAAKMQRLGPARLRPGTGRIAVNVSGEFVGGGALDVELIGVGRNPCVACGDVELDDPRQVGSIRAAARRGWERTTPCPICGFARDRSIVRLGASASLEFRDLASGNYALRLVDEHDRSVGDSRELRLREGESARVDFDLSSERYVEIECFDVGGKSLSNVWRARLASVDPFEEREIVGFDEGSRRNPIALEFVDDTRRAVANAELDPPLPPGAIGVSIGGSRIAVGRGGGHAGRGGEPRSNDRTRTPDDLLWPEPAAAHFGPMQVACDFDENGVARVGPLPSSRLELHATAEHFAADAVVPESRELTRIVLHLYATGDSARSDPRLASYSAFEFGAK